MISILIFNHPLIGDLLLEADEKAIVRSCYLDSKLAPTIDKKVRQNKSHPILSEAVSQLSEYLEAKRAKLTVPLDIKGTNFQKQVYELVMKIPLGSTITYGELASKLKMPRAFRSIGAAIGKNPLLIFVPDHRVLNSSGTIGGFAGKWNRKPGLLNLETKIMENN
jgi:methylated-DNA-[protein]-cysteine S-methyltransferase